MVGQLLIQKFLQNDDDIDLVTSLSILITAFIFMLISYRCSKLIQISCFIQIFQIFYASIYKGIIINQQKIVEDDEDQQDDILVAFITGILSLLLPLYCQGVIQKWFITSLYVAISWTYLLTKMIEIDIIEKNIVILIVYSIIACIWTIYYFEKYFKNLFIQKYKSDVKQKNLCEILQKNINTPICITQFRTDNSYNLQFYNRAFIDLFHPFQKFDGLLVYENNPEDENLESTMSSQHQNTQQQLNNNQINQKNNNNNKNQFLKMEHYLKSQLCPNLQTEKYSSDQYQKCIYTNICDQSNVSNFKIFEVNIFQCEFENNNKSAVMIFTDITQQWRYQNQQINKMKELNETKNRLLANVSHDLRTPLNSIINNIKMAELEIKSNYFHMYQSEKSKSCLEQIQKYHTMINSNSQMLLLLVHDILDHTRSQHKQIQINPEKFSILDLISEMKELLSFPAENKQIKLEFSINLEDLNLYQDKLRLKQIIMNLMGNAIKFTTKGYVKLTVKSVKNHLTGQLLEFSIEDTGIGIKDEQQKHLFQNFSCDDNESGLNPHGIGLGLTISKNLVGLLGPSPSIGLSSKYKKGSTFSFLIYQNINKPLKENKLINGSQTSFSSIPQLNMSRKSRKSRINISPNSQIGLNNSKSQVQTKLLVHDISSVSSQDTRENGSSQKEETDNIQENQITKSLPIMNTQNLKGQYQSLTILLVDDNPFNIQTIKNIIQQAMKGYFQIQFEVAYDGQQALDKISELQNKKMFIDLMIIDYEMPILNGAETMEIITQMQQQQKIDSKMKVWLCSANGIENDIKPKILKKFSQVLVKPIDYKFLQKILIQTFYNKN